MQRPLRFSALSMPALAVACILLATAPGCSTEDTPQEPDTPTTELTVWGTEGGGEVLVLDDTQHEIRLSRPSSNPDAAWESIAIESLEWSGVISLDERERLASVQSSDGSYIRILYESDHSAILESYDAQSDRRSVERVEVVPDEDVSLRPAVEHRTSSVDTRRLDVLCGQQSLTVAQSRSMQASGSITTTLGDRVPLHFVARRRAGVTGFDYEVPAAKDIRMAADLYCESGSRTLSNLCRGPAVFWLVPKIAIARAILCRVLGSLSSRGCKAAYRAILDSDFELGTVDLEVWIPSRGVLTDSFPFRLEESEPRILAYDPGYYYPTLEYSVRSTPFVHDLIIDGLFGCLADDQAWAAVEVTVAGTSFRLSHGRTFIGPSNPEFRLRVDELPLCADYEVQVHLSHEGEPFQSWPFFLSSFQVEELIIEEARSHGWRLRNNKLFVDDGIGSPLDEEGNDIEGSGFRLSAGTISLDYSIGDAGMNGLSIDNLEAISTSELGWHEVRAIRQAEASVTFTCEENARVCVTTVPGRQKVRHYDECNVDRPRFSSVDGRLEVRFVDGWEFDTVRVSFELTGDDVDPCVRAEVHTGTIAHFKMEPERLRVSMMHN